MDTLFLEEMGFSIAQAEWNRCRVNPSFEEALRAAMVLVGIELIDYGSFIAIPGGSRTQVRVFSKAYRERAERAAGR